MWLVDVAASSPLSASTIPLPLRMLLLLLMLLLVMLLLVMLRRLLILLPSPPCALTMLPNAQARLARP